MNKIIQLQPWRDLLLALTEQGDIYVISVDDAHPERGPTFRFWSPGVPTDELARATGYAKENR